MTDLPSGTVTMLFTDIEGSTRLQQQLGETYADVLAECRRILRTAFGQWHGQEVDTQGDAFFVVFARASDAVLASVEMQRALASHMWPQDAVVRVRIGIHTGEPQLFTEGYVGMDVHHAARIMSAGHGGQILLSKTTADLVEATLPNDVHLEELGEHRLRDLRRPSHLLQLSITGLPSDFPPLKTLDAHPNNLPIQPTSFVGREREVRTVCELLHQPDVRLVTLTGPGGMGKTRLGLQVAAELSDLFTHGVFLVALAPVNDPEQVASAIIQTLGISDLSSQSPFTVLKAALKDKQMLLLLDSFEQVITAAVGVADLLGACPQLKMIITSQVVLRVQAEREFTIPPLSLPNPKHLPDLLTLSQYEAVALFIARAQAVKPDFAVTNANAPAVADICARLDGSPLAIELAAARSKFFAPQALLTRLEQGLAVLTGGARDLPLRQQTLRGAIAWSYHLLLPEEQQLFRRLAVFVDGCTCEAAEVVCRAAGGLTGDVLDGLLSLVDKSLLRQQESVGGEPRFWMLQTLRAFGLEALASAQEAELTRQAHAEYYLALAEEAEPYLQGTEQAHWLAQLEQDHENLRAALNFLLEQALLQASSPEGQPQAELALRLCAALRWFWTIHGHMREGQDFLEQALAVRSGVGAAVLARALYAAAEMALDLDDLDRLQAYAEECLALYQELGDTAGMATSLELLGGDALYRGQYVTARARLEEAAALFQGLGNRWLWGRCKTQLALVVTEEGQYGRAHTLLEECLALYQELGDQQRIGWVRYLLARTLFIWQQDLQSARTFAEQSLAILQEVGDPGFIALPLGVLGAIHLVRGEFALAREQLEESVALCLEVGDRGDSLEPLMSLARVAVAQGDQVAALHHFQEYLLILQELGLQRFLPAYLEAVAAMVAGLGMPFQAVEVWGTAQVLREEMGALIYPVYQAEYELTVAAARRELGEEIFASAWTRGRVTPLEQALAALPHIFSLVEDAFILRQQQAMQPGQAFHIEINEGQVAQEVAEITESDFFQHLLQQTQYLRPDHS